MNLSARKMRGAATGAVLLGLTAVFGIAAMVYREETASSHVMINEVCSNNFSVLADENGEYPDYAELYNPSSHEVVLDGLYLSDNEKHLKKSPLDQVRIPAGGRAVIWLDDSGSDGLHAGFQLSKDGDSLFLSSESGEILDRVSLPKLSYNTSYARCRDGQREWEQMTPTPGEANEEGSPVPVRTGDAPFFSAESGFYEEGFELVMEAADGMEIYYTLDGSEPAADSILYEGPIRIEDRSGRPNVYAARTDLSPTNPYAPEFAVDKATVVRAAAYDPAEGTYSRIRTASYFVGFSQKEDYEGMPVLSLAADPEDLFDADRGIYGNGAELERYKQLGGFRDGELLDSFTDEEGGLHHRYMASNAFHQGKEWEREAAVTFFDEEHTCQFTQQVGIRISGQSTRGAAQKSMNLYGRDIYDTNTVFPYPFFDGMEYSSIKIRNGGSDNAGSKIMDAMLESLVTDRDVSTQASRPCAVFLNGEYWGFYHIRERYGEEYLANHFGVGKNNVWLMDSGTADIGGQKAADAYEAMLSLGEYDMTVPENYALAESRIDLQSLIDFYCINHYIDNMDLGFGQNMALWRTVWPENAAEGDTRWRWMIFDTDGSMTGWDNNTFENSEPWDAETALMDEPLMRSLMKNETFRKRFALSFMDIANTCFDYARVHESLEEWRNTCRTQVTRSHQRFFREDFSEEVFDGSLDRMDEFFQKRFEYIVPCMAAELGLSGTPEKVTVTVNDPAGGSVLINTASTEGSRTWSGFYYTDYPVTVTAVPAEGWEFAGWSGAVSGDGPIQEAAVEPGGIRLYARFVKSRQESADRARRGQFIFDGEYR